MEIANCDQMARPIYGFGITERGTDIVAETERQQKQR